MPSRIHLSRGGDRVVGTTENVRMLRIDLAALGTTLKNLELDGDKVEVASPAPPGLPLVVARGGRALGRRRGGRARPEDRLTERAVHAGVRQPAVGRLRDARPRAGPGRRLQRRPAVRRGVLLPRERLGGLRGGFGVRRRAVRRPKRDPLRQRRLQFRVGEIAGQVPRGGPERLGESRGSHGRGTGFGRDIRLPASWMRPSPGRRRGMDGP